MADAEPRSFDRVADIYDQTRALPDHASAAIASAITALLRDVAQSPHLVEIAIGTGRIAVPVAERGVRVTGTDISPAMVARLREKRRDIGVVFAEATRPPFRGGGFDGALFVDILHLVPDPAAVVRATIPIVRAGGVLILGADDRNRGAAELILADAIRDVTGSDDTSPARINRAIAGFERACADSDLAIDTRTVATWTEPATGRAIVDAVRARTFSATWDLPESAIEAIVAAITPRLAALFGDIERTVEVPRAFALHVARV